MSNSNKKPYNSSLSFTPEFFVPHKEANHLNAQDVLRQLLEHSLSVTTATWLMFEEQDGKMVNTANDNLVANMLLSIQTQLGMVEKILPLAFQDEGI